MKIFEIVRHPVKPLSLFKLNDRPRWLDTNTGIVTTAGESVLSEHDDGKIRVCIIISVYITGDHNNLVYCGRKGKVRDSKTYGNTVPVVRRHIICEGDKPVRDLKPEVYSVESQIEMVNVEFASIRTIVK